MHIFMTQTHLHEINLSKTDVMICEKLITPLRL